MGKIKKDSRPLPLRLWVFQRERAPLYGILLMAAVTTGAAYRFSDGTPFAHYLVAVAIISLYLLQIRTADERKDFAHDNLYHKNRPVQRGVVTLKELAVINKISIISQLILYASFADPRIFLLGLLSQGYAFLTSKEFFVREWIRKHFFTYYISHYIQLVILFYAITYIAHPVGYSYWIFVSLFMAGVITTELGRKMYPVEEDTTDDTYSAQLGHTGSAITVSVIAAIVAALSSYLILSGQGSNLLIIGPLLAWVGVVICATRYAMNPHNKAANAIEQASNLLYIISMLSVILGA